MELTNDIDDVNNGAKLKRALTELHEGIESNERDIEAFNINRSDWKDNNSETWEAGDYRIGKYFSAIQKNDMTVIESMGGRKSPRSFGHGKADLGTPISGDDTGTIGSYMLPSRLYSDSILRYMNTASEVIPKLRRISMQGRLIRWPIETSSIGLTFVTNEVTSKTETNPTISYRDLECETFAGYTGITDEMYEDSFIDIGSWLRQMIVQDLLDETETQALSSATNPFIGVTNYTTAQSLVIDSPTFDGVTWEDLRALKNKLDTVRKRQRCSYFMSQTVWDILSSKQDANGRYFFDPLRGLGRSAWGFPIVLSDAMPSESDSAVSTSFIGFGPLGTILHGIRVGLEVKFYPDTIYSVTDDQVFYRYRTRFGILASNQAWFAVMDTAAS